MKINENEILSEVFECDEKGNLNPEAIGWSRKPYHICNLKGSWLRKKKWNYWCFCGKDFLLSITLADVDYLGLASALFYDFKSKEYLEKSIMTPFGKNIKLGNHVEEDISFISKNLSFSVIYKEESIEVEIKSPSMSNKNVEGKFIILKSKSHESLNVLIPWSKKRFQFTSKQNSMPIRGFINVDEKKYEFEERNSFAVLDFGRGKWKYKTDWNWGSFSGYQNNDLIGINLGAGWTDGTGYAENGFCINGKLYILHDEVKVDFNPKNPMDPWKAYSINTNSLDLTLKPTWDRAFYLNLGIIMMKGHQCFGYANGRIKTEEKTYKIKDIFGWIEDCHYRW
ncbi:MAG: DUF2804 domain-containing protein [Promethearchaeota archaeon]